MPAFAPLGRATEQPGLVTIWSPAVPVAGLTASKDSRRSVGAGCLRVVGATTLLVSSAKASAPTAA